MANDLQDGKGLLEVIFFLMFDSRNRDVAIWKMAKSGNVATAAKINNDFALVNDDMQAQATLYPYPMTPPTP